MTITRCDIKDCQNEACMTCKVPRFCLGVFSKLDTETNTEKAYNKVVVKSMDLDLCDKHAKRIAYYIELMNFGEQYDN